MSYFKVFIKAILPAVFIYLLISSIAFASDENSDKIDSKLLSAQGETKVIVTFSKKPAEYKNFIKSVGGEIVYDYNNVEGLAIKVKGEDIQKLLKMSNVLRIQEDGKVKALLHDSAPLISTYDVWYKGITGKDVKVCIVDTGVNYSHPALDPYCRFINVVDGTVEQRVLESSHPYPVSYNHTWNVTRPGFSKISVHFVNISLENGYDFIYIKDASGNTVQTITGNYKDFWSVSVPGDTIEINLVSDWYGCYYGFYMDEITDGISKRFDNCTKFIGGYNFVNNDDNPMDDNGHGTHIAGIISSNDAYSRGIANGTKILVAKVLDSTGNGDDSNVIAGIDWCINNSAQIISMSLGGDVYPGTCDNDSVAEAVNSAVDKGVTVVVAAGNEGSCGITAPACASKAIAVGSVDKNRSVATYSSKGPRLDILAPGSNINSTFLNGWASLSGTSMATPHVSGVVALMLEANPSLTPSFIKDAIISTADPVNTCYDSYQLVGVTCTSTGKTQIPCTTDATGAGIINASRAVDMVSSDFSPPKYSDINTPSNPTAYSPNAQYSFSIKWIDDKALDTVLFEFNGQNYTDLNANGNIFTKVFNDLSIGNYYFRWYANDTSGKWNYTDILNFTIRDPSMTNIIVSQGLVINDRISIQTRTKPYVAIQSPSSPYHKTSVPLNVTIDRPSMIKYSLDGQQNVTNTSYVISYFKSLTGLTNGNHSLIVYATDSSGNIGFNTTNFSYCLADINDNKQVDLSDLGLLAKAYNSHGPDYHYNGEPASTSWNSNADINGDGIVNLSDLGILAKNYNNRC